MNKDGASANVPIDLRSITSQSFTGADALSDDDEDAYSNDFDYDHDDEEDEIDSAHAYDKRLESMVALAGIIERFDSTLEYCAFNHWKEVIKVNHVTSRRGCMQHRSSSADEPTPSSVSAADLVARARAFNASMCQILNNWASTLLLRALQKWCSLPQPTAPSSVSPAAVVQVRGKNVMAPINWKALHKSLQQPPMKKPQPSMHGKASNYSAAVKASLMETISPPLSHHSLAPTPPPPPPEAHHHQQQQLEGRYLNRRSSELLESKSFRQQSSRGALTRPPSPPPPTPPTPQPSSSAPHNRTPPSNPCSSWPSSSVNLVDRAHCKELLEADVQRLLQRQACPRDSDHAERDDEDEAASYAQVSIPPPRSRQPRPHPASSTSRGNPKVRTRAAAVHRDEDKDHQRITAVADGALLRAAAAERLSGSSTLAQQVAKFKRSSSKGEGGGSVGLRVPLHLPLLSLVEGDKFTLRDLIQPHVLVVWITTSCRIYDGVLSYFSLYLCRNRAFDF